MVNYYARAQDRAPIWEVVAIFTKNLLSKTTTMVEKTIIEGTTRSSQAIILVIRVLQHAPIQRKCNISMSAPKDMTMSKTQISSIQVMYRPSKSLRLSKKKKTSLTKLAKPKQQFSLRRLPNKREKKTLLVKRTVERLRPSLLHQNRETFRNCFVETLVNRQSSNMDN